MSNQSADTTAEMTPFQELVASLVSDSLSILPSPTSDKITESIKNGMEIPDANDEIDKNVLISHNSEDIAFVAAYVVKQVYGAEAIKESVIPQTILYTFNKRISSDPDEYFSKVREKILISRNRDRDIYNEALNAIVSALAVFYSVTTDLKEGVYLRDTDGGLYLYSEV